MSSVRHYPLSHAKVQALATPKPAKRDRFILAGFIWGNVGGYREGVASRGTLRLLSVPQETPCGQKMPNMSTVANIVTYPSSEIIDKVINMFINVGTQKPANGRFD